MFVVLVWARWGLHSLQYMKGSSCTVLVANALSCHKYCEMRSNGSVEKALSLISNGKSKVLGLTVGKHNVTPGQRIPRAGEVKP